MVVQGLDDGIVTFDPLGRVARARTRLRRACWASRARARRRSPRAGLADGRRRRHRGPTRRAARKPRSLGPASRVQRSLGVPVGDGTMRWLDVSAHPIERTNERWVVVELPGRLGAPPGGGGAPALDGGGPRQERVPLPHEPRAPDPAQRRARLRAAAADGRPRAAAPRLGRADPRRRVGTSSSWWRTSSTSSASGADDSRSRCSRSRSAPSLREVVELVQPLADASGVTVEVQRCRATTTARYRRRPPAAPGAAEPPDQRDQVQPCGRSRHDHCGTRSTGHIVVRVRDTGRGVAPDQLEQIFLPFERLDADALGHRRRGRRPRALEAPRRGDGRPHRRRVVGRGGEHVLVRRPRRRAGRARGAIVRPDAEPLSDEVAAQLVRAADGPPRRLLYIEDNPASRTLLEQLVARRGGFEVVAAATAAEGLRLARRIEPRRGARRPPPARRIRRGRASGRCAADPRTADIPVIVLTADATADRRETLVGARARMAYLTKPLDAAELFLTLDGASPAVDALTDGPRARVRPTLPPPADRGAERRGGDGTDEQRGARIAPGARGRRRRPEPRPDAPVPRTRGMDGHRGVRRARAHCGPRPRRRPT